MTGWFFSKEGMIVFRRITDVVFANKFITAAQGRKV
jgi:hypothetical protein